MQKFDFTDIQKKAEKLLRKKQDGLMILETLRLNYEMKESKEYVLLYIEMINTKRRDIIALTFFLHRCKYKETHSNGQVETSDDQTPVSTKNPMEERSTPLSPRMGGQYLDQSVSWGIDFTDVEVEDVGLTQLSNDESKDELSSMSAASHTITQLEKVSWIADNIISMTNMKDKLSVECFGDHHGSGDALKMAIVTDNVVSTDSREFNEEKEILSDTTFETNERSLVDGNDDQSSHELPDSREHSDGIIVDDVRLEKNRPTPVNIEPSTFHKMSVAVKPRDYEDSSASNSKDTVYSQGNGTHDSSRVKHSVYTKHPESKDCCNSTTESTAYNQPAKKLRIADLRSITQKTLKDSPRQQSLPIRSNSKSVILLDQFHVSGNSSNRNRNARDDSKQNKRGLTNESSHDEQVPRKKGCSSETPSVYRSPRQAQQNENQGVCLREFATTNLSPSISKNGIRPPENNRNKSTKSTGGAQMLKFALSSICKSSSRANNPKLSNL